MRRAAPLVPATRSLRLGVQTREPPGHTRSPRIQASLLAGLAVSCLVSVGCTGEPAAEPTPTPTPTTASPEVESSIPLDQIQETLRAGDRQAVREVLGIPQTVEVDRKEFNRVAAELRSIQFEIDEIAHLDQDTVTVPASVGASEWLVYLVNGSDGWRITLTEEIT